MLNEIIHVNYLAQCLAQSKHTETKGLGYAHTWKCTFNWPILLYIFYKYVCVYSSYLIAIVKIRKPHLKWSQEALERGLSATALPLSATCRPPARKKCALYFQTTRSLHILEGGREIFSWLATVQPMGEKKNTFSQWEATTTLNSYFTPMNFHFKQPFPTSSFPL